MRKDSRSLEELITLQDQAIQALRQANEALKLALAALEKARNEVGYVQPMFFPASPAPNPYPPYSNPVWSNPPTLVPSIAPNTVPNPQWQGGTVYLSNGGMLTNAGSAPQITLTKAIDTVKGMIQ